MIGRCQDEIGKGNSSSDLNKEKNCLIIIFLIAILVEKGEESSQGQAKLDNRDETRAQTYALGLRG